MCYIPDAFWLFCFSDGSLATKQILFLQRPTLPRKRRELTVCIHGTDKRKVYFCPPKTKILLKLALGCMTGVCETVNPKIFKKAFDGLFVSFRNCPSKVKTRGTQTARKLRRSRSHRWQRSREKWKRWRESEHVTRETDRICRKSQRGEINQRRRRNTAHITSHM